MGEQMQKQKEKTQTLAQCGLVAVHNGHNIELTDTYYFIVSGPDFDNDAYEYQRTFPSLIEAKEKIDARVKTAAKQKRMAISLPVLDESGDKVTIRGIHTGTSDLLGLPEGSDAYPDVPWLQDALKRRARYRAASEALNKTIQIHRIRRGRGYGRISADRYDDLIEALKKDHAEALKKALAVDQKALAVDPKEKK